MCCAGGSSGIGEKKREMKCSKLCFSERKNVCGLFTDLLLKCYIFILTTLIYCKFFINNGYYYHII